MNERPTESGQTDTMNKGVDPMRQLTAVQAVVSVLCVAPGAGHDGLLAAARGPPLGRPAGGQEKREVESGPLRLELKGRGANVSAAKKSR